MSVRERARDLSCRLSSTDSNISFPIVYRKFQGKTVSPSQGTIIEIYQTIYTRCYEKGVTIKELAVAQGVIERGDLIFRITEDKLTPRSEEDEIYKSIYRWGAVSISQNATLVNGSSVNWGDIEPGDKIRFASQGTFHRVATIVNVASKLYLSEAYGQAALTAATYHIYRPYQVVGWEKRMAQAEYFVQGRKI